MAGERAAVPLPGAAGAELDDVLGVIRGRHLRAVFQPIVDLATGRVFAHEALVRTSAPRFRSPAALFTAAIEERCCGLLGRAIREIALDTGPATPLFLNIHPNEFDENWLVRPDEPMFYHESSIYLEVTESVPLSHFQLCRSILREIRGKGVNLAVDDLGAGYSNLKYISDLSPEIVKLDRELVAGLRGESRAQRLVRSLVRLCEDMGARVVAEGIETIEELEAVRDSGVHFGQGFLLAPPSFPPPPASWPAARRSARG